MALILTDFGTILSIVLFLSLISDTLLARVPSATLPAPVPGKFSELRSVSPSGIYKDIAIGCAVFVVLAVLLYFVLWKCCYYCRKADEDSNPFTYRVKDLNRATNNFSGSNLVGEGAFGSVYRADFGENRIAAVKKLREVDSQLFTGELSILLRMPRHPNLVNLVGFCSDADNQMILFEYVANGTLFSRLHENQGVGRPLSWAARKEIARQVGEALRHLHEEANPPIIHRDVKSKNVLLENDFSAKLADFGIAKLGPKNNRSTGTNPCGTPGYMDPQYVRRGKCSTKSDVYSFGVLLLELITGSEALIGSDALVNRTRKDRLSTNENDIMKIVDQSLPHCNELQEMIAIANLCLQRKKRDRPSMAQIVNIMQGIGNAETVNGIDGIESITSLSA